MAARTSSGRLGVPGVQGKWQVWLAVGLVGLMVGLSRMRPPAAASALSKEPAGAPAGIEGPTLPPFESPEGWVVATPQTRLRVERTIRGQLEALKEGDFEAAVECQSRALRQNFQSVDAFRQMLESSYPQFLHYRSLEIGEARSDERARRVMVSVTVTGEDGVTVRATYLLIKEDGKFRVESVFGGQFGESGEVA